MPKVSRKKSSSQKKPTASVSVTPSAAGGLIFSKLKETDNDVTKPTVVFDSKKLSDEMPIEPKDEPVETPELSVSPTFEISTKEIESGKTNNSVDNSNHDIFDISPSIISGDITRKAIEFEESRMTRIDVARDRMVEPNLEGMRDHACIHYHTEILSNESVLHEQLSPYETDGSVMDRMESGCESDTTCDTASSDEDDCKHGSTIEDKLDDSDREEYDFIDEYKDFQDEPDDNRPTDALDSWLVLRTLEQAMK